MSIQMKYVIHEKEYAGNEILLTFGDPVVDHDEMIRHRYNILGAGFCEVGVIGGEVSVTAYGESILLGVQSRRGEDAEIIREFFAKTLVLS